MAIVTSVVPLYAASLGLSPSFECLNMFSSTTTELSTNIPMAITTPPIDTMFSVIPVTYIRQKVANIDVGMDTPITTDVFQSLKKNKSTNIAKIELWNAVDTMLLTESLI